MARPGSPEGKCAGPWAALWSGEGLCETKRDQGMAAGRADGLREPVSAPASCLHQISESGATRFP